MRHIALGLLASTLTAACAASAQPPQPSLSPMRAPEAVPDVLAELAEAREADGSADVFTEPDTQLLPDSVFSQGGLVFGKTQPGALVTLDDKKVPVDAEGNFILGFGRDHPATAALAVRYPGGTTAELTLDIADREFFEEEIEGVAENTVNPWTEEDLAHIRRSTELKNAARRESTSSALWLDRFDWPAKGRISGRFGSRRIYNGTPKRPHSGVDVARPRGSTEDFTGTPVLAPSAGVVRLAEPDMFFEGGLVFIDHGQNLESALMHMSALDVKAGDYVEKGDKIGEVGMTGRATGPHVHWSLKWHDRLLDPELVVPPMD